MIQNRKSREFHHCSLKNLQPIAMGCPQMSIRRKKTILRTRWFEKSQWSLHAKPRVRIMKLNV